MRFLRRLGLLLLLALLAGGYTLYRIEQPYRGFQGPTFVEFPHGTGTSAMADALAKAGVVRSRWDFLLARLTRRGHVLQAGEYRFEAVRRGVLSPVRWRRVSCRRRRGRRTDTLARAGRG